MKWARGCRVHPPRPSNATAAIALRRGCGRVLCWCVVCLVVVAGVGFEPTTFRL